MREPVIAGRSSGYLTSEKIKVCMICDLYLPLFSGASVQAHNLAMSLMEKGVNVFVLAGRYFGTLASETIDRIPIKRLRLINSDITLVRPLSSSLSLLSALWKNRRDYDILHIHSIKAFDFIPILMARLLRKKVIVKMTLLGSPSDPATWATSWSGYLMRPSFTLADRVISISSPLSENYKQSGLSIQKLRHLPQGVDINRFHPVSDGEKIKTRVGLGLQKDVRYLGFVGTFKHRKGADILIDAFLLLAEQYSDLYLLVIGSDTFDDPVRSRRFYDVFSKQQKNKIDNAGLLNRVVFTGQTDKVEFYLQASDVFVFPSRREGFGTAIIEAMAVGLPCIIATLDGIAAEITADGESAVIIDSELPDDYANAVSLLLSDAETSAKLGIRARQRVEETYSMDIVTNKYIALYRELLGLDKPAYL